MFARFHLIETDKSVDIDLQGENKLLGQSLTGLLEKPYSRVRCYREIGVVPWRLIDENKCLYGVENGKEYEVDLIDDGGIICDSCDSYTLYCRVCGKNLYGKNMVLRRSGWKCKGCVGRSSSYRNDGSRMTTADHMFGT